MASNEHPDTDQKPKPSGKKARRLSQKEQSERFRQTAQALEAEDGAAFDQAFDAVVTHGKPSRPIS